MIVEGPGRGLTFRDGWWFGLGFALAMLAVYLLPWLILAVAFAVLRGAVS